jgi:hypothetical protein
MNEPKPLASLSSGLLARKGGAAPAMRSQLNGVHLTGAPSASAPASMDDLGFNDMGEDTHEASVVSIHSEARRFNEQAKARRSALANGRSAAFTLRLDAERHLKLRMACTLANRSAQQLVTDALDTMISNLPDVAVLAAQAAKRR